MSTDMNLEKIEKSLKDNIKSRGESNIDNEIEDDVVTDELYSIESELENASTSEMIEDEDIQYEEPVVKKKKSYAKYAGLIFPAIFFIGAFLFLSKDELGLTSKSNTVDFSLSVQQDALAEEETSAQARTAVVEKKAEAVEKLAPYPIVADNRKQNKKQFLTNDITRKKILPIVAPLTEETSLPTTTTTTSPVVAEVPLSVITKAPAVKNELSMECYTVSESPFMNIFKIKNRDNIMLSDTYHNAKKLFLNKNNIMHVNWYGNTREFIKIDKMPDLYIMKIQLKDGGYKCSNT